MTPLGCTPWRGWAAEERAVCRAPWTEPARELGVSPRVQGPGDEARPQVRRKDGGPPEASASARPFTHSRQQERLA